MGNTSAPPCPPIPACPIRECEAKITRLQYNLDVARRELGELQAQTKPEWQHKIDSVIQLVLQKLSAAADRKKAKNLIARILHPDQCARTSKDVTSTNNEVTEALLVLSAYVEAHASEPNFCTDASAYFIREWAAKAS